MAEQFHYLADLFELLVETIPKLFRGKKAVILFFQGAGVMAEDLAEVSQVVHANPDSINKYDITRRVLTRLNARGDTGLRARREVIKRVTEFESFETCWDKERLAAKGLVASVREAVQKKDAFTRMQQERDSEREIAQTKRREEQARGVMQRAVIDDVTQRLYSLFAMDNRPQERGKLLEGVLNDLFRAYGIHVKENFIRRSQADNSVALEQIDGVIEISGVLHLVEMKWLKQPVGVGDFSQHLVRVMGRPGVSGILISSSGFTEAVLEQCAEFLNMKTTFLCTLEEIVMLLQRRGDLIQLLKAKSQAAVLDKQPFLKILN